MVETRKRVGLAMAAVALIAGCGRVGFDEIGACAPFESAEALDDSADSRCYGYFGEPLTWPEAARGCEIRQGHLVTITNAAENDRVASLIPQGASAWIGAEDRDLENNFVWVTGESFGFTAWALGQPDDPGDEDCLEQRNDAEPGWHDQPCDTARAFICER